MKLTKKDISIIFVIFIMSRLLIMSTFEYAKMGYKGISQHYFFPKSAYIIDVPIVKDFTLFDSYFYSNIARFGYNNLEEYDERQNYIHFEGSEACFFPLYPYMIRAFLWTGLNPNTIGFIISNILFIISLIFLKKLLLKKNINSFFPLIFYSFFPSSMYFSAVYTESLFLVLTIITMYYSYEKKWWIAITSAFLATFTRNIGVALSIFIFFEYLDLYSLKLDKLKKIDFKEFLKATFYAIIPISGILLIMIMQKFIYGDYIAFITNQNMFARIFVGSLKFMLFDIFAGNILNPIVFINVIVMYFTLFLMIRLFLNKEVGLSSKMMSLFIFIVSSTTIFLGDYMTFFSIGYMRYILLAVPIFIESYRFNNVSKVLIIMLSSFMLFESSMLFYFKLFIA